MKTYLINAFKDISTTSQFLDFTSTIKAKEWVVFNEDFAYVEKFFFVDNENLLVSVNGKSSYSKWKYIKINSSLLIDDDKSKYLFKIVVCNKDIIVLNIDSTNNYSFLINSKSSIWKNVTYNDIQWYLIKECGIDILNEEQREQFIEEQKINAIRKKEEAKEKELQQQIQIKRCLIIIWIILSALIAFTSIKGYINYKKKHPTIYKTETQNQVAVDLGLSVKWAICNVGANSPKEFGNYYAWGEPTGTDVFGYDSELVGEIQKRFPKREYNTPPPYSIINSSYDIAKQNWGEKWRMPTKKEVQELLSMCNIVLDESDGKKIVKAIGPNGNFIIFPSTGFLDGTDGDWIFENDEYSIYLYTGELYSSVSTYEYADNQAAYLFIGDTYDENLKKYVVKKINSIDRYRMLPVRAVLDK